jgi:hypothetical protein
MEQQIARVLAIVAIAGFAIQQLLQILDPLIIAGIAGYKRNRTTNDLPGGISDADFKKAVMTFLGFLAGIITVKSTDINTLALLDPKWGGCGDTIVTALVISGGTEGFNTLLKYFGYVKEARKQALDVVVTIIPATASVANSQTAQFIARVDHGSSVVIWRVVHGGGGTIDDQGVYTAPTTPGTYQLMCTSISDPTRPALATVTVI